MKETWAPSSHTLSASTRSVTLSPARIFRAAIPEFCRKEQISQLDQRRHLFLFRSHACKQNQNDRGGAWTFSKASDAGQLVVSVASIATSQVINEPNAGRTMRSAKMAGSTLCHLSATEWAAIRVRRPADVNTVRKVTWRDELPSRLVRVAARSRHAVGFPLRSTR